MVAQATEPGNCQGFSDEAEISSYAKNAMEWAVAEKLLQGYTDGTLRPKACANRAELAAILVRYYENKESN